MEYLRSVFDKTRIKLLIIAGGSLLLGLILVIIGVKSSSKLTDQNMAARFSKGNDFAEVSVFLSELSGFDESKVKELTYKIQNRLTQDSITPENEDARNFIYSYSANGEVEAVSSIGSTKVKTIGIAGDYFLFHPRKLVSGSFFPSDYVMKDLVVIDVETAWALFGSNDVIGQTIKIGGTEHIVTGVVEHEKGRLNELAGNNEPTIYLSYESLAKNGQISYINTFEALLPNPLTTYARDLLEELVPVEKNRFEVVQNTGRFHFTKLLKNVKNFGTRGMNAKGIVYPYWENIARGMEDYLTPVACFGVIFFGYPIVLVICLLIRMWRKRTFHWEEIKDFVTKKIEEYREKKKLKVGDYYENDF